MPAAILPLIFALSASPAEPTCRTDGVTVSLFVENPLVVTPTGIAVDNNGRVFVAESHTHFRPDDYDGPPSDRILLLSDADADGKADLRTVFHEGFTHVMDLEFAADDSLYVATRMDIHRMRDTDGDGVADEVTPIIRMKTTGTYPHNGISGLCFNADGTLNFGLGENLGHKYTMTGTDGAQVKGGNEGGSTWHVRADGSGLRKVTTGWWNPFGMCVNAQGRIFGTDNDPGASPPCRLIQIHESADYGYEYRYGRTGLHPLVSWTGDLPGNIPMIAGTGEAPCGIISTERTNLPASLRDDLLVACWADHRIERFDIHQPANSGQVVAERHAFVMGPNDFRPVGLCVAPNGDIFVSDWILASYQLHGRGRVWRIHSTPRLDVADPTPAISSTPTVEPDSVAARIATLNTATLAESPNLILNAARSRDPVLRHFAIQALVREIDTSEFAELTMNPSAPVLLALKRSKRRRSYAQSGPLKDVLDGKLNEAWEVAVKWIADDRLQSYQTDLEANLNRADLDVPLYLMLTAALDRLSGRKPTDVPPDNVLAKTAIDETMSVALRAAALRLLNPESAALSVDALKRLCNQRVAPIVLNAIRQLRYRTDEAAAELAKQIALDGQRPQRERVEAVGVLATARDRFTSELLDLTADGSEQIARAACQALTGLELSPTQRAQLQRNVAGRTKLADVSARTLSKKSSRPDPEDIDAWMTLIDDSGNVQAGERVFFHSVIGTCGRCHQHGGRGRAVGPGLSLIARRLSPDREEATRWLLETILQPDRDMAPQYTPWIIVTKDGKQLTGLPRRKGGSREAYLGLDGREFTVEKDQIEFHEESRVSIMPKGLLQNLTQKELNDLFAFLLSSK